jgi:hypothetical protein
MKPQYFILNEAEDERFHIGTIIAATNEVLAEKVMDALQEHFDAQVNDIEDLDVEKIKQSYEPYEFSVLMDEITRKVSIEPTWLY